MSALPFRLAALALLWCLCARAHADERPSARRELVRISLYGGAGYANEHKSDGLYGAGVLQVSASPVEHLLAGLNVELYSNYDRRYSTRLPSFTERDELLSVNVSEKLRRGRLLLGYELLHFGLEDDDLVQLTPYAFAELMAFLNDVWPQRHTLVGGGALLEVRLHPGLRLLLDFSYGASLRHTAEHVDENLLFGALRGTFRMGFGAAFAIHPRAHFELRYLGELLQYGHATRVLDTLLFGPVFHLR